MTERPAVEPGQGDTPAPVVRRRLQSGTPEDKKGRGGCLATGAILGVIIGIMFALYGLGPILRHFYGEEEVAAGQAWVDGEQRLQVTNVRVGPDAEGGTGEPVIFVTVAREGFIDDEPRPGRFRLEVERIEDWLLPLAQLPVSDTSTGDILLRFDVPEGLDPSTVNPVAVHLEDPLVRFEIGEVDRE